VDPKFVSPCFAALAAIVVAACASEREIQITNLGGRDAGPGVVFDGPDPASGGQDGGVPDGSSLDAADIGFDGGGCRSDADCNSGEFCHLGTGGCATIEPCTNDDQCHVGHICNEIMGACECVNDDSCKDWPDGRTECNETTKVCSVPETPACDPPCNEGCQKCADGACMRKEGIECCTDDDCLNPPLTTCDLVTFACVTVDYPCPCEIDSDCRFCWECDPCFCKGNVCDFVECASDADCEPRCTPGGIGVCESSYCRCAPAETGLCSDCSLDPRFCDSQGLTCGSMTKKCTRRCESSADCIDDTGLVHECNEFNKICNCAKPSCCAGPCVAPQVCDEVSCTCM